LCTAIGNRFGRRKALVISSACASIGHVLQASSHGLPQMIIGRLISGLEVGSINTIVPVWQLETSKQTNRGPHVVVLGSFVAAGLAVAAWINYGLSFVQHSSVSWRLALAIPLVFTGILISTPFCFPESPRWLVQNQRMDEARAVLSMLEDRSDDALAAELEVIRQSCEVEKQQTIGFRVLFTTGRQRLFYRTVLAFLVNFNAQMTGVNVISYYATSIFSNLGFPSHRASLLAAAVLTWKTVAAVFAFISIDRFGRKPLFIVSGLGMSVSMMCLAISVSHISSSVAAGRAAAFFLFLFMTFFPLGFLGANFLYSVEISPQNFRVHLSAVGTAVSNPSVASTSLLKQMIRHTGFAISSSSRSHPFVSPTLAIERTSSMP
jgi:sugar porter (SP) family MFS transporter